MAAARVGVKARGLAALNRDLGRISKTFRRDSISHLRGIGNQVRTTARGQAPAQSGQLARSLRVSARNTGASITTTLPYAGVIEYGGTIAPRGTQFAIAPAEFITGAVQEHAGDIEEQLGDLLDRVAALNGFRP